MFDGLAGRGAARGAQALMMTNDLDGARAPRPGQEDRAAASVLRPQAASPAAILELSEQARTAMANQRGSPAQRQERPRELAPLLERDPAARAPPLKPTAIEHSDSMIEMPKFEPTLLGSATSIGDALARYELLMSDPGLALAQDSPIRILPRD